MGLFNRRKQKVVEQAVIVHYKLSDDEFGLAEEREALHQLEDSLESQISRRRAGEVDGHEFGNGEAVLYCYGPDADALFALIEHELRSMKARPAYVILRYGEASDPDARERRVDL